jgi:hypothetical protein
MVRAVVLNCTVEIQGRKYLTVAGYQAVANAFGWVASARDVVRVEGGWQAIGEVKRMSDGMVLSSGVGFLGDDEKTWATRPQFSKMAMVQTRACGRALRAACGFMAPVIDAKLETTVAEEMELVQGSTVPPAPTGTAGLKAKLGGPPPSPPPAAKPSSENAGEKASHDRSFSFRFGKSANVPLHLLSEGDLKFYAKCLENDLASNDPKKQQYASSNTLALANVQAEIRVRGIV